MSDWYISVVNIILGSSFMLIGFKIIKLKFTSKDEENKWNERYKFFLIIFGAILLIFGLSKVPV